MIKKNELKNLIYIQENNQCNEQTINGLFRSIVEPILEHPTECVVLIRLSNKDKRRFDSIIKRLGFTGAKVYDYSDNPISEKFEHALREQIWEKTEFIYVLSERYGATLIFDYEDAELDNYASYYTMYNSKHLNDAIEIINANSWINLETYSQRWHPDRRENDLMNSSLRKLIDNLNESNRDIMISQFEKEQISANEDAASQLDFLSAKASYVAHEMKNFLSIGNLYFDIIQKQADKISYADEEVKKSVTNAHNCIYKTLQMCINELLDFRSMKPTALEIYNLKSLLENAVNLSKIYAGDNIKITLKDVDKDIKITADENKLTSVVINLIKNAVESIKGKEAESDSDQSSGIITVSAEVLEDNIKIIIANTGKPIDENMQKTIFDEGFTTKKTGGGLGLKICQKTMEEQYGSLVLLKSDEKSTEFEITVLKG